MSNRNTVIDHELNWDHEAEVVVIGAALGGFTAAVNSASRGLSTLIVEKASSVGGTARKAGAWMWIPDNHFLRESGIVDDREDALRYMARMARPAIYDPDHPSLGLTQWEYDLLAAFFDNGHDALRYIVDTGALDVYHMPELPDYGAELEQDKVPCGRVVTPRLPDGTAGTGVEFVRQMVNACERMEIPILTDHGVTGLYLNEAGEVVGIKVETPEGERSIRARKAVVMASGGFGHNEEMRREYIGGLLYGGCGALTNQGDLHQIVSELGVPLSNMHAAWLAPMVLEIALRDDPEARGVFSVPGDSTLWVNRHGRRALNEMHIYNDKTLPMLNWSEVENEYPNHLMFAIWDERCERHFGMADRETGAGDYIPSPGGDRSHVVSGETLAELAAAISERLEKVGPGAHNVKLAAEFTDNLEGAVERFNSYARSGVDEEFRRGETPVQLVFREFAIDPDNPPENEYPNPTMYPISEHGPYHATIIAPSAIDTKGGPRVDTSMRVLDAEQNPVPGLYGIGNCVYSGSGQAYFAGGATFGPAIAHSYVIGKSLKEERAKELLSKPSLDSVR